MPKDKANTPQSNPRHWFGLHESLFDKLYRFSDIDDMPVVFPENNYVLRDIDGLPVWVPGVTPPEPGHAFIPEDAVPC